MIYTQSMRTQTHIAPYTRTRTHTRTHTCKIIQMRCANKLNVLAFIHDNIRVVRLCALACRSHVCTYKNTGTQKTQKLVVLVNLLLRNRVQMTLILIKLFNLEPFNSSLWICKLAHCDVFLCSIFYIFESFMLVHIQTCVCVCTFGVRQCFIRFYSLPFFFLFFFVVVSHFTDLTKFCKYELLLSLSSAL